MRKVHLVVVGVLIAGTLGCTPAEQRDARETAETVGTTAEARLEDGAVTAAVKAKLLADQTVSGMRIDVDTRDGVVTLTGTAASAAARERANELARTTEGVTRVDDRLSVAQQ